MMISIICVYNNEKLLNGMLISSLNNQTLLDYELILIDSIKLDFKSASKALNYGYQKAKGDILVFTHQDIELLDDRALEKINDFCLHRSFGLGCVAGVSISNNKVYSSVLQGESKTIAGEKSDTIMEVDAADECFFFIKKDSFKGFSCLGETWHLYAVDYSIKCKIKNETIYLLPISIYHLSTGITGINDSYWNALYKLRKLYKKDVNIIPTVFGSFKTNHLFFLQVMIKKTILKIRNIID